MQGPLNINLVS